MEQVITVRIEKLPEEVYLATSDELQGLVAQGRTIAETLEIARDVARRLIEARAERRGREASKIRVAEDCSEYSIVIGA